MTKPGGTEKEMPRPRMQEGVAAHIAFLRRVAVEQAVDAGEEGVAVARAGARRAELPGMALRQIDALRRVRMAGQEVEAGVAWRR